MEVIIRIRKVGSVNSVIRNWKTSAASLFTAFFMFVLFSPEHFAQWPWLIDLSKFASIGGLAAMGIVARDYKKVPPVAPAEPQDDPAEAARRPGTWHQEQADQ